jgi:NTP pyrophosphatase (non-canonical NTP hydrolase)
MLDPTLVEALLAFRRAREWEQFHTPKNLAIAISVEAGELLEQFQWTHEGAIREPSAALRHEMADVAILLTYLAHDLGVDLSDAVREKLADNDRRYPVDEARGSARKSPRQ